MEIFVDNAPPPSFAPAHQHDSARVLQKHVTLTTLSPAVGALFPPHCKYARLLITRTVLLIAAAVHPYPHVEC